MMFSSIDGGPFSDGMTNMECNPYTSNNLEPGGLATAPANISTNEFTPNGATTYQPDKKRWFVLFVVALLNMSSAMMWISFAPITNFTDEFYCANGSCGAAVWLSLVFMVLYVPVGFVAIWGVDSFGLRSGILIGCWFSMIGGIVRVISSISSIPMEARFPIVMTGQTLAAIGQPFLLILPTKLAALWFPDDQRAIANTIASMSYMLGIFVAMLLTPALVDDESHILRMNCVILMPAVVVTVLATIGVRRSTPVHPPSASAAQQSLPFWKGLQLLFKKDALPFWVLAFCLGGGVCLFNSLYTLLQQILCTKGYDDAFAGYCGAALIVGGIVGSVISGVFVDKTKLFEETAKVAFCLAALVACAMGVVVVRPNVPEAILSLMALYGMFGFALYPIGLEMGVETTYPVPEATSTGIIIAFDQILGSVFVVVLSKMAQDPSSADMAIQKCRSNPQSKVEVQDWLYPVLAWVISSCFLAVTMTIFFRPLYKRIQHETDAKKESKANVDGDAGHKPTAISPVGFRTDHTSSSYAMLLKGSDTNELE